MPAQALTGAAIFDGQNLRADAAVVLDGTRASIQRAADLPGGLPRQILPGGVILPGFVDLQVNGGGGVMLSEAPSLDTLARLAEAHRALGTRHLLPTLITSDPETTAAAISATEIAIRERIPGILGLHLEGPHLAPARAGAHDPALIRPMEEADLAALCAAADRLPTLMVTLAPEAAQPAQIRALANAGVIVSLGHSDCDYDTAMRAIEAGARCVTHLFNAMSPLNHRAPGLVGAALDSGVHAGVIADGIHVHPAALRSAHRAKTGQGRLFAVSDAMTCAGTEQTSFTLGGRKVERREGRLTLADGTLAGADLTLARAVEVLVRDARLPLAEALAMVTAYPAALLRDPGTAGRWPGTTAGLIHLGRDFSVRALSDLHG